jgi:hypothetical protein
MCKMLLVFERTTVFFASLCSTREQDRIDTEGRREGVGLEIHGGVL